MPRSTIFNTFLKAISWEILHMFYIEKLKKSYISLDSEDQDENSKQSFSKISSLIIGFIIIILRHINPHLNPINGFYAHIFLAFGQKSFHFPN